MKTTSKAWFSLAFVWAVSIVLPFIFDWSRINRSMIIWLFVGTGFFLILGILFRFIEKRKKHEEQDPSEEM